MGFLKPRIHDFTYALELETLVFLVDAKTGLIKMLPFQMIYVSNMTIYITSVRVTRKLDGNAYYHANPACIINK